MRQGGALKERCRPAKPCSIAFLRSRHKPATRRCRVRPAVGTAVHPRPAGAVGSGPALLGLMAPSRVEPMPHAMAHARQTGLAPGRNGASVRAPGHRTRDRGTRTPYAAPFMAPSGSHQRNAASRPWSRSASVLRASALSVCMACGVATSMPSPASGGQSASSRK